MAEVGGQEVMEQEESLDLEEPDHELEHVQEKMDEDIADPDWYCELEEEEGDSSDRWWRQRGEHINEHCQVISFILNYLLFNI